MFCPPPGRAGEKIWQIMGAKWFHRWCGLLAGLLFVAPLSMAQLEIGNDLQMKLNGNIGYAYNGNINNGLSGHSMGFTGDANLTGSYYNPNFLNFNVQPYYDRTQSNSVYSALTNTSGVNANVNLFSGSHFPGSFNYSKGVNSTGQFGIPGSDLGLAAHGNFQGFGVTWSELLPRMPTLTASYAISDGSSSIFGTQEQNTQSDHTLSLLSTYSVAGFRLAGGFIHRNVDFNFNQTLAGVAEPTITSTANNNYQFSGQHSFPLQGSYGFSWSRSTYGYDYHDSVGANNSGASDSVNGNLTFRPAKRLSLAFTTNYNDSLLGSLPQTILSTGTLVNNISLGSFRSLLFGGMASYQLTSNLDLQGIVNRQQQYFLGKTYEATQYGGNLNFNAQHRFLGSFSFSFGLFNTATQDGNNALGFTGNLNFGRKVAGWDIDANVSYSQNVQAIVLLYTTSSVGYVTNVRRRLGNRVFFLAGYSGSHSALTQQAGTSSSSERWSSTFTFHTHSLNGFYSKSDGAAALTTTGLVAVPIGLPPSVFAPGSVMTYNSRAYGANASTVAFRRLTLSGGYADSTGTTVDPLLSVFTSNQLYNAIVQYRLRKIFINGGYTRLRQSVGSAQTAPVTVTSYFIGVSRWFDFF